MSIPVNIVVAWSGQINEIPSGWLLCNGTNGTPDLRNRFIVGAGADYSFNSIGGSANSVLPTHSHGTSNISTQGSHTHSLSGRNNTGSSNAIAAVRTDFSSISNNNVRTNGAGSHSHNLSILEEGEDPTNKNLPPYLALAFIMFGGN